MRRLSESHSKAELEELKEKVAQLEKQNAEKDQKIADLEA